jgi:hypothetical protein
MRHMCRARTKANEEAKELYRKERCAQLRRYSAKELGRTLASGKSRNVQNNKRRAELLNDYPTMNASKLRKGNPVQGRDAGSMTSGNYGKHPITLSYSLLMACCL